MGQSCLFYLFVFCNLNSVLSPVLNMPISDSKRQRVLVASCVLYSEVCIFSLFIFISLIVLYTLRCLSIFVYNHCSYHTRTSGQVYHAVSRDQKPLRKQYLEAILPPFVAVLRRWRPLLAGIHELATGDGLNPLIADDRALAADSLPIEVLCCARI